MSDVCLILEGTYPYVTGGVSTCVYQLITQTPNVEYSIIYIGAQKDPLAKFKYPIPENVKLLREIYLYDYTIKGDCLNIKMSGANPIELFHKMMISLDVNQFEEIFKNLFNKHTRHLDPLKLLESKEAWNFLEKLYNEKFPAAKGVSFLDYFYHWRFTYFPLFNILTSDIPQAKIYHALCTGYAGLLGVAAKLTHRKPLIITEHGIYTHEREIEIYQADWIHHVDQGFKARSDMGFFKDWWIKMFHFMGSIAYRYADTITTLHDVNKNKQIKYGASESKIKIFPNGVNVSDFDLCREDKKQKKENDDIVIALIGRVVAIKDIKTFIKAINFVYKQSRNIKVYLIGPETEEPEYAKECRVLVDLLNLQNVIIFTGRVNIKEYLKEIDLVVLSSISEGQPMVILEAYAAGIPVVSTDVGGCREMIEGASFEDGTIGPSGKVVAFGDPKALGEAIFNLVSDKKLLKDYSKNAFDRVYRYYQEDQSIENYFQEYKNYFNKVF